MNNRTERFLLLGLIVLIVVVTLLGPAEKSLGTVARIIYIHGALVWVAILTFAVAALLGILALVLRTETMHRWCRAAGRTALLFWVGYLPLSMWAARAAWGRVFLQDPSFQRAFRILAVAIIVQVIIWLRPRPNWVGSALNIVPFAFLFYQQAIANQFMHPDSPIRNADSSLIQVYFYFLTGLCILLAWLSGRLLLGWDYKLQARTPK